MGACGEDIKKGLGTILEKTENLYNLLDAINVNTLVTDRDSYELSKNALKILYEINKSIKVLKKSTCNPNVE